MTAQKSNLLLVLIVLFGFALRLYRLGAQSLWYDETVSAFLAAQPATELIAHTARDIHPPGYYLLLHYWTLASGNTEFVLAWFSLIFGVLLIPLIYHMARYTANRQTAIWAAVLVAFSPYNIWYSQEVRMYTLGAALGLIAAYCALKAQSKNATAARRYWVGYIVAAAAGLYVLYYFVFLLIALNIFFLFYTLYPKIESARLKALLIANSLIFVAYLPWLPTAWQQATNPPVPSWRSPPNLNTIALESWAALSLGQSVEPAAIWPVLIVTLIVFALGLRYLARNNSKHSTQLTHQTQKTLQTHPTEFKFSPVVFLLIYTFGPLLLIYLLSFITPLYHIRYIFTCSPAFYIVLGAGLSWLATRTRLWIALLILLILFVASLYSIYQFHFDSRYGTDDYRSAVDFIQRHWQPGDAIVTNAGYTYTAVVYYSDFPDIEHRRLVPYSSPEKNQVPLLFQTGTVDGSPNLGWNNSKSDFYPMSSPETVAALEQLSNDYPRLWMLRAYDTVTDPDALIRTWLAKNAILLEDEVFSGQSNIRAQGFLLNTPSQPTAQTIHFEDGMALAGWHLPKQRWQAGQTIPIQLWWTTSAPPSVDYKMSLKMWTPQGNLAASGQDEWPAGTFYRATGWPVGQLVYHPTQLTLPADVPPGQYWLNVELYHPETIAPLARQDNGENAVTLGPVTVEP